MAADELLVWWQRQQELMAVTSAVICAELCKEAEREERAASSREKRPRKQRSSNAARDWSTSPFNALYLAGPRYNGQHRADPGNPLATRFRRNFRMDRPSALLVAQRMEDEDWAAGFGKPDALGKEGPPIELLVLCSLNALGRGTVFDQFEELAGISGQTVRKFFLKFCEFGARVLAKEYIALPQTQEDFEENSKEFEVAGLPGCLGCTDGVQIPLWKCAANLSNSFTGKEGYPTLGFNVTVNFRRQILHVLDGIPGRMNDKTKARRDELFQRLGRGDLDFTWTRISADGAEQVMRGPYLVVDGGYTDARYLVAPSKDVSEQKEAQFSEWLESVRKCVECTFGILKVRFTILNHVRFHNVETVNNVFLTCAALHNMLLKADGLDQAYEHHMTLDRTMELVARLFEAGAARTADEHEADEAEGVGESGLAAAADSADAASTAEADSEEPGGEVGQNERGSEVDEHGADVTAGGEDAEQLRAYFGDRAESASVFRKKLIEHWHLKMERSAVKWPSRTGRVARISQTS